MEKSHCEREREQIMNNVDNNVISNWNYIWTTCKHICYIHWCEKRLILKIGSGGVLNKGRIYAKKIFIETVMKYKTEL